MVNGSLTSLQSLFHSDKQLLGTETVRELRAKGVKSIICGLSANDLERSFLNAGADSFMAKPVRIHIKLSISYGMAH
jgi:DNA-binding response OmpR family regulator